MSAEPEEGKEFTPEELEQRYARIADLRSQEMRLQEELTEIEKKGAPQLTMENIAHVIEMWTKIPASKIREEEFRRLSRQQGQGTGIPAAAAAGAAPEAEGGGPGRGHCRCGGRHPAQPRGHLPQA